MKILLINNFHYRKGGSETVYFNTAEVLRKAGHEVIFFSREENKNLPCEQSEYFIPVNRSVSKLRGAVNYFYNREAKKQLEKLIEKEHPDLAHVHLFWGGISPSIFGVLRKYRIPLIHTAHDYRMVCPAYTFNCLGHICEACKGKFFYRCALKRCSKGSRIQSVIMAVEMYFRNRFFNPIENIAGFIFVSEFSKNKHVQYMPLFEKAKTTVLYNYTVADSDYHVNSDRKYFLFFGRLSPEKGVAFLIDVFAKHPDWHLKIVGTGPLETELKAKIVRLSLRNVEMVGYKTGAELKSLINAASFVVVPSEWYENNPLTIIESYSLHTPVIGAGLGGIPEIIEDGSTGYVYRASDGADLERVLRQTVRMSESDYVRMAENAYRFYERNFSEEAYCEKLIGFYNEIRASFF